MAKKNKSSGLSTGIKPSEVKPSARKPLIEIPEDEQRRLIEQTGILKRFQEVEENGATTTPKVEYVEERLPLAEEIFNATLYIIPFSFLLLMMEILIHQQYRQMATIPAILDRMVPGVPILSLLVFYTLRYKHLRSMQAALFIGSLLASSSMIYNINRANYIKNMKQDPPLATLWIFAIVQLDLGPSVLSLFATAGIVWWNGWTIFF